MHKMQQYGHTKNNCMRPYICIEPWTVPRRIILLRQYVCSAIRIILQILRDVDCTKWSWNGRKGKDLFMWGKILLLQDRKRDRLTSVKEAAFLHWIEGRKRTRSFDLPRSYAVVTDSNNIDDSGGKDKIDNLIANYEFLVRYIYSLISPISLLTNVINKIFYWRDF